MQSPMSAIDRVSPRRSSSAIRHSFFLGATLLASSVSLAHDVSDPGLGTPPGPPTFTPITICGADDLKDATCFKAGELCANPAWYTTATSVARFRMLWRRADKKVFLRNASSFLFKPPVPWAARRDLLLTNAHVVDLPPGAKRLAMQVEFFAEYAPDCACGNAMPPAACGVAVPNCRRPATTCTGIVRGIDCWTSVPACDWALFKITAAAPAAATAAILGMNPIPGDPVYIPQHPSGRCKEIDAATVPALLEGWEFEHVVDTQSGSSGSPVIYQFTDEVRGIHFRGGCTAVAGANGAVKIEEVTGALPVKIPLVIDCSHSGIPTLPSSVPLYELLPEDDGEDILVGCLGDLNFDLTVDAADLGLLLAAWDQLDLLADLNDDGIVGADDLGLLMSLWGPCPE